MSLPPELKCRASWLRLLPTLLHWADKADYSISSKEFYDIYKQWCEDNACHSVSAIRFSAELRQNDRRYNLEATNNIYLPGGRRVRGVGRFVSVRTVRSGEAEARCGEDQGTGHDE